MTAPARRPGVMPPGLHHLVLDRPARGNALSADLVDRLAADLQVVATRTDLGALLLTGDGPHFCTGFDLTDLDTSTDTTLLARFVHIELLRQALCAVPCTTIAWAHGRAWGAGADLLACTDERWAAASTTFRFPGAQFGLVLGTRRLARLVGADRARRWVRDGSTVGAAEALQAGLVTRIVEAEDLQAQLHEQLQRQAIDGPTLAAVKAALPGPGDDAALADLVRSAARPGLRGRIQAYRDRLRAARGAPST
ncbi:enoyl-CoA hydratase/isomerase family protein [Pseudorhodoferax sp.]|uniref:enoyl-CoA hydratase/isomerase family protein n=1 Tax=Pseudorhodoferax sp. TaxID=1993553 RepID=UPI002DD65FD7|nr:enoyl-CoA hydratase/isomerase family protein [Pseudorhodoferax sp.]